jgi:hypothetical protein
MPFRKSTKVTKKSKKESESESKSESELDFKNNSTDSESEEEKKPTGTKKIVPKKNNKQPTKNNKQITKKMKALADDDDENDSLSKLVDSDNESKNSDDSKSDGETAHSKENNKYKKHKDQLTLEEISKLSLEKADNISIMRYLNYRGSNKTNPNPWLSSNMKRMLHESRYGIPTSNPSNTNNYKSKGKYNHNNRNYNDGEKHFNNKHFNNNQRRYDNVDDFVEHESGVNFRTPAHSTRNSGGHDAGNSHAHGRLNNNI